MGASIGDIVATLGVDADPWVRGMGQAMQANRSFADSANSLASIGRGVAGVAEQASKGKGDLFDFAKAGNSLLQVLAPLAGPKGVAIAAVADVGMRIADSFRDASGAADEFAAKVDKIADAAGRLAEKNNRGIAFAASLEQMSATDPDAFRAAGRQNDIELAQTRNSLAELNKARRSAIEDAIRGGFARNVKGWSSPDSSGPGVERFFGKDNAFLGGLTLTDDTAVAKVNEFNAAIRDLTDSEGRLLNRQKAINEEASKAFNAKQIADKTAAEKAEIARFEEMARTPLQKAEFEMAELQRAAVNGSFSPKMIEQAGRQIIRNFAGTQGQANGALQLADVSSSAGVAAVQAALRQRGNTPEVEILRQLLEETKKLVEKNNAPAQPINVVQQGIN